MKAWLTTSSNALKQWLEAHKGEYHYYSQFRYELNIPELDWQSIINGQIVLRREDEHYAKIKRRTGLVEFDPRSLPDALEGTTRTKKAWGEDRWNSWVVKNRDFYKSAEDEEGILSISKDSELGLWLKNLAEIMKIWIMENNFPHAKAFGVGELKIDQYDWSKIMRGKDLFHPKRKPYYQILYWRTGRPEADPRNIPEHDQGRPTGTHSTTRIFPAISDEEWMEWVRENFDKYTFADEFRELAKQLTEEKRQAQPEEAREEMVAAAMNPATGSAEYSGGERLSVDLRMFLARHKIPYLNRLLNVLGIPESVHAPFSKGRNIVDDWQHYAAVYLFTRLESADPRNLPPTRHFSVGEGITRTVDRKASDTEWLAWKKENENLAPFVNRDQVLKVLSRLKRHERIPEKFIYDPKKTSQRTTGKRPERTRRPLEITRLPTDQPKVPEPEPEAPRSNEPSFEDLFVKAGRLFGASAAAAFSVGVAASQRLPRRSIQSTDQGGDVGILAARLYAELQKAIQGTPEDRDRLTTQYLSQLRDLWVAVDPFLHDRQARENAVKMMQGGN